MTTQAESGTTTVAPSPKSHWSLPTLRELPKLTALTLASAIGGTGGTGGGGSTVFGLLLAVGVAFGVSACSNDRGLSGEPNEGPTSVSQLVTCIADRTALTLSCGSPSAAPGTVVLGGQGKRVALRSSNVSYNGGSGILSADVTVQNLSAFVLGSLDGTTPSPEGVRVFFVDPPSATPTGTVAVNNPTGTATFTSGSQAYYEYPGMLAPQGTSSPLTWEFLFSGGATSFTFSVLVSADVRAVGGIMRWAEEPGLAPLNWTGISGWGADSLALFGPFGELYFYQGGTWSSRNDPSGTSATRGVVAVGPNDVTIMNGSFATRRWDGISWRQIDGLPGGPGSGGVVGRVGGSGKAGACAFGFWQRCFDGSTWTDIAVTGSPNVVASTVIQGKIVVLTTTGRVWSRDSSSGVWTEIGAGGSGQTQQPGIVFGSSLTSIWTISTTNNTDPVIRYWNGTSWATQAVPGGQENNTGTPIQGAAFSATDAWIVRPDNVSHGHLWHYDGVGWTDSRTDTYNYNGLWGRGPGDVYLAAAGGRLQHLVGGIWNDILATAGAGQGVWALGSSSAFVIGQFGEVRQYDGTRWTTVANLGVGGSSIYAVDTTHVLAATGGATLYYFDGAGWGPIVPNGDAWTGVGGSGPHDFWAVGRFGAIYHLDPGVSSGMVVDQFVMTSNDLKAVWGRDQNFAVTVGQGGVIGVWNGTSWGLAVSPTGNQLNGVSGTSSSDVWAVGDGGVIVHFDGTNWSTMASGTGQNLRAVWAASPTEVYAVGNGKTILAYNGVSWSPASFVSAATGTTFYGVSGRPNGQVLVVGDRSLRGTR